MEIQETGDGLILSVRVRPNSGRFAIYKKDDDAVLELTSPAMEGRANQEIMREIPRLLRCEVRILRGAKSKRKLLLLKGITEEELEAFLEMHAP
jgi:uncharacterized protein (TIGR00251 family)